MLLHVTPWLPIQMANFFLKYTAQSDSRRLQLIKCHIPKCDNYIYCNMGAVCGCKFKWVKSCICNYTMPVYIFNYNLLIAEMHSTVCICAYRMYSRCRFRWCYLVTFILLYFLLITTTYLYLMLDINGYKLICTSSIEILWVQIPADL